MLELITIHNIAIYYISLFISSMCNFFIFNSYLISNNSINVLSTILNKYNVYSTKVIYNSRILEILKYLYFKS